MNEIGLPRNQHWFKLMLIISNTPGGAAHVYSSHLNVKVMLSLSHITSILLPLDQGVMANFKASEKNVQGLDFSGLSYIYILVDNMYHVYLHTIWLMPGLLERNYDICQGLSVEFQVKNQKGRDNLSHLQIDGRQ
jgi:hypothetical protein